MVRAGENGLYKLGEGKKIKGGLGVNDLELFKWRLLVDKEALGS